MYVWIVAGGRTCACARVAREGNTCAHFAISHLTFVNSLAGPRRRHRLWMLAFGRSGSRIKQTFPWAAAVVADGGAREGRRRRTLPPRSPCPPLRGPPALVPSPRAWRRRGTRTANIIRPAHSNTRTYTAAPRCGGQRVASVKEQVQRGTNRSQRGRRRRRREAQQSAAVSLAVVRVHPNPTTVMAAVGTWRQPHCARVRCIKRTPVTVEKSLSFRVSEKPNKISSPCSHCVRPPVHDYRLFRISLTHAPDTHGLTARARVYNNKRKSLATGSLTPSPFPLPSLSLTHSISLSLLTPLLFAVLRDAVRVWVYLRARRQWCNKKKKRNSYKLYFYPIRVFEIAGFGSLWISSHVAAGGVQTTG